MSFARLAGEARFAGMPVLLRLEITQTLILLELAEFLNWVMLLLDIGPQAMDSRRRLPPRAVNRCLQVVVCNFMTEA
jgi:hypothetical protein